MTRRRAAERKTTPKPHVATVTMSNGTKMPEVQAGSVRMRRVPSMGALDRMERETIVLWRHPIDTVTFAVCETFYLLMEGAQRLWTQRKTLVILLLTLVVFSGLYNLPGAHQMVVRYMEKKLFWCFYWAGLGVLSSIGLGTGLHTFLLYLGPHIASVTLAAFECESVRFPEPPYPDQIICPLNGTISSVNDSSASAFDTAADSMASAISLWAIMSKVRLESIMWGAGTALGELPPYFMARAARLSGQEPDDEEYREFQQLMRRSVDEQEEIHWMDRAKLFIEKIVERVGFLGILICASIPNPLFDLAGITCGHFLVPFWTFFGATLIGKAIVKMHIQQLFVIVTFSEHHVEKVISLMKYIPLVGKSLQAPFKEYLSQQKKNLHRKPGEVVVTRQSWLAWLFECLVVLMVAYFLLSLVNSLAQRYHKRKCQLRRDRDRQASLQMLQKID